MVKLVRFQAAFLAHFLGFMLLYLAGNYQLLTAEAVGVKEYTRHDFPPGFIFGSSTSAYQVEGAAFEDGRKASIFDTFAHTGFLHGTGDVATDEYHKYNEDVRLMVETGLDAYRFSISWSRLIPDGRGQINPKGLQYYNNLINELIRNGIQPHVTLLHQDVPQTLEDEYLGFLNPRIIKDFTAYADVCFRQFGDRVRYWTTINEANLFVVGGYNNGDSPPNRCNPVARYNCTVGNSSTEPYIATHNVLLAHASVAKLYKEKYQAKQHGFVGFSMYAFHFIPSSNRREDATAAQRARDFFIGWYMHPLIYGDYPKIMKSIVGSRLPVFTTKESELVKGSSDFIGLNYYTIILCKDNSTSLTAEPKTFMTDMAVEWISINQSAPMGQNPFPNIPWGLQGVLELFKQDYGNPPVYIHENGQVTEQKIGVNDRPRAEYLQGHIGGVLDAVRNGCNTKGYFVWSFIDSFELLYGYQKSLGLYYINFSDPNLTRYPKLSQRWYSRFLKGEIVAVKEEELRDIPTIFRNSPKDAGDISLLHQTELLQHMSS